MNANNSFPKNGHHQPRRTRRARFGIYMYPKALWPSWGATGNGPAPVASVVSIAHPCPRSAVGVMVYDPAVVFDPDLEEGV